jgi:hypothetical protein
MDEEDGFRTTPPPRQNPLLSFARGNVTLLASVVAALFFAIRLLAVTRGDLYTASILLAETSLGDAIRVLLFSVAVPLTLYVVTNYAGFLAGSRGRVFDLRTIGLLAVSVTAFALFFYLEGLFNRSRDFAQNVSLYLSLCFPTTVSFFTGRWARLQYERPLRFLLSRLTIPAFATLLLFFGPPLIAKDFWLPRERLDFQNEAPFTGYVLKESGDYLVILNDEPRVIVQKDKATLEDRDFCYPEDHKARSSKQADAPICP